MAAHLKKILLVDDSPFMLAMLANAFEKESFMVIKSSSAIEALKILEVHQFDIILSDYEMPVMNGFEFRRRLLDNVVTKNIPFAFLTSHKESELVMEGLDELQAVDFINKDTPLPVITAKLDNLISTVRQKQAMAVEELRKAAEAINVKSIPVKRPETAGFEIDFWHQPYQGYPGGDFIDFIQVNGRYTFIVLGDVMGKKWIAWFFTFSYLSYIRAAVRFCVMDSEYEPAYILKKINQAVCQDEALADVLAGLSVVMIDEETGAVAYAGAGDLPLLHYKAADKSIEEVKTSGLLLGWFDALDYETQRLHMQKGDQLLIFSDGVIEFLEDGKRKSDYTIFKDNIHGLIKAGDDFAAIKQFLRLAQAGSRQTDDCSIISVVKN